MGCSHIRHPSSDDRVTSSLVRSLVAPRPALLPAAHSILAIHAASKPGSGDSVGVEVAVNTEHSAEVCAAMLS